MGVVDLLLILQVQPKHIKEAFRLLGKSIIRVEQPDIHLEEDEEVHAEHHETGEMEVDTDAAGKSGIFYKPCMELNFRLCQEK